MPMMITVQLRARGTTWSTGPQVSGGVAWKGALALRQRVLHSYRYKRPDPWECGAPSNAANGDMARSCYLHCPDPVSAFAIVQVRLCEFAIRNKAPPAVVSGLRTCFEVQIGLACLGSSFFDVRDSARRSWQVACSLSRVASCECCTSISFSGVVGLLVFVIAHSIPNLFLTLEMDRLPRLFSMPSSQSSDSTRSTEEAPQSMCVEMPIPASMPLSLLFTSNYCRLSSSFRV